MRFERIDDGWAATLAPSGPAGCVGLRCDPLLLEFDRIDHGRLVRLDIFDDALDASWALGQAWDLLQVLDDSDVVDLPVTDSPLWAARFELAAAARLADDVQRLEERYLSASAALAAAELADVLHGLGGLAPLDPYDALARCAEIVADLDDPLELPVDQAAAARELAERLRAWVPSDHDGFDRVLRTLAAPLETRPPVHDPDRRLVPMSFSDPDAITWTGGSGHVAWPGAESTATLRREPGDLVHIEAAPPAGEPPGWVLLFHRPNDGSDPRSDILVAGGPMAHDGSHAIARFGPVRALPTHAVFTHEPYGSPERPLETLVEALTIGRLAVELEESRPGSAALEWWHCALRWLRIAEVGRAAIAFDRCAALPDRDPAAVSALQARQHADAFATAWATPFLDGRSGHPFRPLWLTPAVV